MLSFFLGITNFNLIGQFGSMEWLGNFYIIFSYNVIFAVATALCLVTKFTKTIIKELINRFATAISRKKPQANGNTSLNGTHLTHSPTNGNVFNGTVTNGNHHAKNE